MGTQPPIKVPKLAEDEEQERFINILRGRIWAHDENRKIVQDKLRKICDSLRAQINELEDRINEELEEKFIPEDNRLQSIFNELRGNSTVDVFQKVKAELLVMQSYDITENKERNYDITTFYKLETEECLGTELMEMRKLTNVRVINGGKISVSFTYLNPDEERVFSEHNIESPVKYKCSIFKRGIEQESKEYFLSRRTDGSFTFTANALEFGTMYGIRVKMVLGNKESEWSDIAEFTPGFKECCAWRKCPDNVNNDRKYNVDINRPRVAAKANGSSICTVIGNASIPLNAVTSWVIKVVNTSGHGVAGVYVGVAPSDINQNEESNYNKCGWYLNCYNSTLRSGPPHKYSDKSYGPRKVKGGEYVRTSDSFGVVMDAKKGDLSFTLNGVSHGVAYERIPLDKPLVPCVLLCYNNSTVELII